MEIIDYQARHQSAFKRLNVEWIEMHWQLEEADHQSLDHPEEYIIAGGGHIFLALDDGEVVGTCALIRISDTDYELAKMSVDANARGNGIGAALGNAVIDKALLERAEKLYLESNTILEPAIRLYRKLGFEEFAGEPSPYARCNIQMVLDLNNVRAGGTDGG
ncbi:MAG: GNAT family N-acetyltransferase [Gammaproteobacteria bacterium]|nr:GNAT family N-acetyltransferase [Gammaproteobacteria bacterium]